ncbi:S-adenosyl-L-methionine-dependent methyltransferase [Triangularia verruculosa]|uniref:S-adenosyl-L-methionine-dependent methyltransferase n=1 Tax=Triangularia verruculosa TaxID=2587418 RepID=A0AAN6XS02_9PEZI|nr:S-adenosyl-L-methionine-dependent methyltransferase [Triangularia verruculosa]
MMTSTTHTPSALPSDSAADDVAKLAAAAAAAQAAESAEAEAYERTHVHGVYEAIAPHFSATRYKPWPAVASFLQSRPPGAVGLDVGCGNGKYLGLNPSVYMVGSDRSASLVALASSRGRQLQEQHAQESKKRIAQGELDPTAGTGGESSGAAVATEVLVADGLSLPFRERAVDFVICIAVIHHMSTRTRRQEAIRHLLRCVRTAEAGQPGGQILVYVWALEQGSSRRGWDEGGEQDLLVPWVLKSQQKQPKQPKQRKGQKGTQDQNPSGAAASNNSGEAPPASETTAGPAAATTTEPDQGHTDPVFKRYYHLYRKGELEEDVLAAGGAVITSGYEKDNWWVVAANEPLASQST